MVFTGSELAAQKDKFAQTEEKNDGNREHKALMKNVTQSCCVFTDSQTFIRNITDSISAFLGFRLFVIFVYISMFQNYLDFISEKYDGHRNIFISYGGLALAIFFGFVVPRLWIFDMKNGSEVEDEDYVEGGRNFRAALILEWELLLDCFVSFVSYATYGISIYRALFQRYHELTSKNIEESKIVNAGMVEATFVYAAVGMIIMREWGFHMTRMTGKKEATVKFYAVFNLLGILSVIKQYLL